MVIPSLTEAYGSSRDAPASEIPLCTLHNFPYLVEHCIQLSREQFETYFKKVRRRRFPIRDFLFL